MRANPSTQRNGGHGLWTRLRAELQREIRFTRTSWPAVQAASAELSEFAAPADAIAWFHAPGFLDEKDRAYRTLIALANHGDHRVRRLARTLIWLGLWPALDCRVAHAIRLGNDADDVVVDYTEAFLRALAAFNDERVKRVAATIVHNTARDARELRRRRSLTSNVRHPGLSDHAGVVVVSERFDVVLLRRELAVIVEGDADIVLLSTVVGLKYEEIAERAHLRTSAVNKRVLRAFARLRNAKRTRRANLFAEFAAETRVCIDVKNASARCPNHPRGTERPLATKRVGTSLYCADCADFLLAGNVRHLRGWSCLAIGDEGPGICPACLVDVYRARGGDR